MSLWKLTWKNLWHKPAQTLLVLLLLVVGVGTLRVSHALEQVADQGMYRYVKGIDMVVGAQGSPLQLILSSLFHIDNPTGNISIEAADDLAKHPLVNRSARISYGDAYKGYRIVGADAEIQKFYQLTVQEGKWAEETLEAVIGMELAEVMGLKLGDTFESTHGLGHEGKAHSHDLFKVVGILSKTDAVYDQLIFTPLSSIWKMHPEASNRQVTALLLNFKNALGKLQLPRMVNAKPGLQAAVPSLELERLQKLSSGGVQVVAGLSYLIILLAFFGLFGNLWQRFQDRRKDLSLLRTLGYRPRFIAGMIQLEALWMAILGFPLALLVSAIALVVIQAELPIAFQASLKPFSLNQFDLIIAAVLLFIAFLAALIPTIQSYKRSIDASLRN